MKITKDGLNIIKESEQFRSKPYLCPAGKATIGFGSTYYEDGTKVTLNDIPISEDRANQLMCYKADNEFGAFINKNVKVALNQNQFDALVSFVYNIGTENFRTSRILKLLNQNDFELASKEFEKWNKSNGKVLDGLIIRREKERQLFTLNE